MFEEVGHLFVADAGLRDDQQAVHVLDGGGTALVGPGGHAGVGLAVDGALDEVAEFLGPGGAFLAHGGAGAEEVAEGAAAAGGLGGRLRHVAHLEPRRLAAEVRNLRHEVLDRVRHDGQVLLQLLAGGHQDVAGLDAVPEVGAQDELQDRLDGDLLDLEVHNAGRKLDARRGDVRVDDNVQAALHLADVLQHIIETCLFKVQVDTFLEAAAGFGHGLGLGRNGLRERLAELRQVFPGLGVGVPQVVDLAVDAFAGLDGGVLDVGQGLDGLAFAGSANVDLAGLGLQVQQVFAPPAGPLVDRVDHEHLVEDLDGRGKLHALAEFGGPLPELGEFVLAFAAVGLAAVGLAAAGLVGRLDVTFGLDGGHAALDVLAQRVDLFAKAFLFLHRQHGGHVDDPVGLGQRTQGLGVVLHPLRLIHLPAGVVDEFLDVGDDPLPLQRPDVADDVAERLFAFGQKFHGQV